MIQSTHQHAEYPGLRASDIGLICRYLLRDWKADKPHYSLSSRFWRMLRSSRALLLIAEHSTLCQLDVYRNYLAESAGDQIFHHLSNRHYLAKSLSVRQRIRFALTHYCFEVAIFNSQYKRAVYLEQGLTLWTKSINGVNFRITLSMGGRMTPEGDLCLVLFVDQTRLHSTNFSWVNSHFANGAEGVIPFITRNQGCCLEDTETLATFEAAFSNNSPRFFCLAAMQGIARAINADRMIGINSALQICYKPNEIKHFVNAYDAFWESVGASKIPSYGYSIPVPFFNKPLSEIVSRHRKRAASRRRHWVEIDESARRILEAHMVSREHQATALVQSVA